MKKLLVCGLSAVAVAAVVAQILPDVRRYLRMRSM
ncbi:MULTISPECIES: hypothetical protein [unclassified Streptomyces]|jgi:hypothetical protein|nr:hypothetical protein SAMN02745898_101133 [Streptomyces sp. 136MFCol5.1]